MKKLVLIAIVLAGSFLATTESADAGIFRCRQIRACRPSAGCRACAPVRTVVRASLRPAVATTRVTVKVLATPFRLRRACCQGGVCEVPQVTVEAAPATPAPAPVPVAPAAPAPAKK